MPIELLVPIGIFVLGIIVSIMLSNLGIQRIIEKRPGEEELGRTAAYAAPFKDSTHELADSISRIKK
ncbi:MAG: hypothetical protein WA435_10135 [Gallionellaceae bacterium]